jgi:hypothetical protein
LFLNQCLKESRNKIICKLYEEETIAISAFKVSYEIYREDGGNGITFVHMLYIKMIDYRKNFLN